MLGPRAALRLGAEWVRGCRRVSEDPRREVAGLRVQGDTTGQTDISSRASNLC